MTHVRSGKLGSIFAALFLAVLPASGQAIYGSLYGTVTDASGAAIANATVTVTDIAKGTSVVVLSNGTGNYTAEHLIPDSYAIKVTAGGFQSFETKGVVVNADSAGKVDASLGIGASEQTVEVNASDLPLLKTDRADVATVFNSRNTEDLPLPSRNFTGLQLLLPGAQLLGWSHASSENPQGSQQIIINGQHFAGVGYELDGTDNQDPILGIIVINPTLDSVEEAKITTQNYDAQFGKAVAAVVSTQTKSGTNRFHGGVYDFRQSSANQAKNPFNAPDIVTGKIVPAGLRNQFGALIGGPILKDKAFFFFDYEGVRQKVGTSNGLLTVPTNLLRTSCAGPVGCDFSDYVGTATAPGVTPGGIYNPATGLQYVGNIIPKAQLNAAAVALLEQYPAAILPVVTTSSGTTGAYQNYPNAGTGQFNFNQFTVRLDGQATQKIHTFGRYSYFKDTLTGKTAFGALGGIGYGTGGYGGTSTGRNQSIAIGADIVVTPKWLTDVRFGFFRYNITTQKYDGADPFATNNGIPGLNVTTFASTGGAPEFDFNGVPNNSQGQGGANFGSGLGATRCNCPLTENERQFQVVNNWTHELGNHSIKFGVDLRHAYNLRVPSDQNRAGQLGFDGRQTSNGGNGGNSGLAFASFVLGDVNQFQRYVSNTANAYETQNRYFFYAQDTWRATPKLTLNYGLRWENYLPERTQKDQGSLLNLSTGNLQVAGEGPYNGAMGVSNAKGAFAPRLGVAYQYNSKTVIRAGYGRSFDIGVFGSIFGHAVTQNLPVLAKQNVTSSGTGYAFMLGQTPPAPNFGTAPVNGVIRLPDGINANARPTTERFPTLDAYNVAVERVLGHQYTVTAAYVGNKGTHTFAGDGSTSNPNQVAVTANGLTFNPLVNGVLVNPALPRSDANDPHRRRYYPLYGWTQDINYFGSEADTHFNALQLTLDKRFSNGYQFKVNYAYQVAKNYNGDYLNIDRSVEYGNQDDLRRNQVTFFGNLELPFGRGKAFLNNSPSIVQEIVGGIELSPTFNIASGLPFWPGYSNCGADRDAGPCTPNYSGGFATGLGTLDVVAKRQTFFKPYTTPLSSTNPTDGPFSKPAFGTFGNLQRNSFFGPKFFNVDMAAQKSFSIKEYATVVFRTDFFNLLNHQNFSNPNTNIDSSDGGQIGGLAIGDTPRTLQFALRVKF